MSRPPGTQATPTQSSLDNSFQPLSPSLDVSSPKEPYLVQRLEAMSLLNAVFAMKAGLSSVAGRPGTRVPDRPEDSALGPRSGAAK